MTPTSISAGNLFKTPGGVEFPSEASMFSESEQVHSFIPKFRIILKKKGRNNTSLHFHEILDFKATRLS